MVAEVRETNRRRQLGVIVAVALLAVPGLALRFGGIDASNPVEAVCFGMAVLAAAFVLSWAAEVVQLDISAGLALALLALIAVLPEYAVDFVFTWRAGHDPDRYASLALANMTGGNQLLIGVGWSMVVLIAVWRARVLRRTDRMLAHYDAVDDGIRLERSHSVEVAFLILATVYGLTLPLRSTLSLVDGAVLVAIFVAYMVRVSGAPAEAPHLVGPAELIGRLPVARRRFAVVMMFAAAAGIIIMCASHFASALVDTGAEFGISEFLLVKWLAPLASEAPELLVAGLFAWRLNTNAALGTLVSSKVNQWTLLVGTLPIVFAISSSSWHGLPLDSLQREELFVTAAQSAFAVAMLANLSISRREAEWLLGMFIVQLVLQVVLTGDAEQYGRIAVGIVYLTSATVTLVRRKQSFRRLLRDGIRTPQAQLTE